MKAVILAMVATSGMAWAEDVTIRVGFSPGGGYDVLARLVADHLGAHLDGQPSIIVSNEPGAGSLKLAKLFLASGASDGSEILMVSSALALNPIFSPDAVDFDPTKVHFLASLSNESSFCVVPKASSIDSFATLIATPGIKLGATGKDSATYQYPAAIKAIFKAPYDIVVGFEGSSEIDLALERGELQARCGISLASITKESDRWRVIAEIGASPTGAFPDATFVADQITDPAERAAFDLVIASALIYYPLIAHPDTPPETVATLRKALAETIADPAFVADAAARKVPVTYTGGAEVEAAIAGFLASDAATKDLARQLVQ